MSSIQVSKKELKQLIEDLSNCKRCNHFQKLYSCKGCALVERKETFLKKLEIMSEKE